MRQSSEDLLRRLQQAFEQNDAHEVMRRVADLGDHLGAGFLRFLRSLKGEAGELNRVLDFSEIRFGLSVMSKQGVARDIPFEALRELIESYETTVVPATICLMNEVRQMELLLTASGEERRKIRDGSCAYFIHWLEATPEKAREWMVRFQKATLIDEQCELTESGAAMADMIVRDHCMYPLLSLCVFPNARIRRNA